MLGVGECARLAHQTHTLILRAHDCITLEWCEGLCQYDSADALEMGGSCILGRKLLYPR